MTVLLNDIVVHTEGGPGHRQIQDFMQGGVGAVTSVAGVAVFLLPAPLPPSPTKAGRQHHGRSRQELFKILRQVRFPLYLLLAPTPFPSVISNMSLPFPFLSGLPSVVSG